MATSRGRRAVKLQRSRSQLRDRGEKRRERKREKEREVQGGRFQRFPAELSRRSVDLSIQHGGCTVPRLLTRDHSTPEISILRDAPVLNALASRRNRFIRRICPKISLSLSFFLPSSLSAIRWQFRNSVDIYRSSADDVSHPLPSRAPGTGGFSFLFVFRAADSSVDLSMIALAMFCITRSVARRWHEELTSFSFSFLFFFSFLRRTLSQNRIVRLMTEWNKIWSWLLGLGLRWGGLLWNIVEENGT